MAASILIAWSPSATATSYTVYRSTVRGQTGSSLGNTAGLLLSDTSAVYGVTYWYGVTATNAAATSALSVQVSATIPAIPPAQTIDSFAASPHEFVQGNSTTLSWATTSATAVHLDGVAVAADGAVIKTPTATTNYTLTVSGSAADVTSTIQVVVDPPPPPPPPPPPMPAQTIDSFAASPATVAPFQASVISWATSNATSVLLNNAPVAGAGTRTVNLNATTAYTLTAKGSATDVTSSITVVVTLTVITIAIPAALVNVSYTAQLVALGGVPPYTWSITSGALPYGLLLSPTGAIFGSATAAGSFPFVVMAMDSNGLSATQALSMLVTAGSLSTVQFTLSGNGPFCIGQPFKQGDFPQDVLGAQVTIKNRWPDGSAKFGIVAGNGTGTITLTAGVAATAISLTTADLKATGVTASIGCGTFGLVSWTTTDWDTPFQTWLAGPQMSSWVYRRAVGTDPHLVAWIEVRLYANGAVEVLPWVENGYLNVAAPTSKNAVYTFALGGTSRFSGTINLPHHCRTPLINGSALSYWLGSDPSVTPRHDVAYLQASELVPTYAANVSPSNGLVTALASTYVPLQAGDIVYDSDSMPSPGYQKPIGLLPQYDVLYLASTAPTIYGAIVRDGFSAGRYPIHYRDEATNRPLRFSAYPTLVIADNSQFKDNGASTTNSYTPTISGTLPPTWDVAHSPSVGFMAYLLTGRYYFMEEVQFAATCNYLGDGDNAALRTGSQGLVQTAVNAWQTRACAWMWRTLAQALCVTPDADTNLRNEFINSVQSNIDHFYNRYVAQTNNPYGWIKPGETYDYGSHTDDLYYGAVWQQDFVTGAFGYSLAIDLPVDATHKTRLQQFFAWKAQSIVRRLGTSSEFWYVNANRYQVAITSVSFPDYDGGTGPWLANDAAVYAASNIPAPDPVSNPLSAVDGVLAQEYDSVAAAKGQWGEIQMAIAYAVRFGVSGASVGYNRMSLALNYASMLLANWDSSFPVMSVKSAVSATGMPVWLAGSAVNAFFPITGTANQQGAPVDAWSGFAVRPDTSEIFIACAGGHNDSSDNRVVSIDLRQDAPAWSLRNAPSLTVTANAAYYPDGKPGSRHIYQHNHWVSQRNRVMMFGQRARYVDGGDNYTVDGFNPDTNTWDAAGTWASLAAGQGFGIVVDPTTGNAFTNGFLKWVQASNTWVAAGFAGSAAAIRWPVAYDSIRNQYFALMWADGQGFGTGVNATKLNLTTSVASIISFNASAAYTQFQADEPQYAGMDYDPINDCFLFYVGQTFSSGAPTSNVPGRVYKITPNAGTTWDISILTLAPSTQTPDTAATGGINSRFKYIPAFKGFVLLPRAGVNLWFLRTA